MRTNQSGWRGSNFQNPRVQSAPGAQIGQISEMPGGLQTRGPGTIGYAGGTPNFNEATGQYAPGTEPQWQLQGGQPQSWPAVPGSGGGYLSARYGGAMGGAGGGVAPALPSTPIPQPPGSSYTGQVPPGTQPNWNSRFGQWEVLPTSAPSHASPQQGNWQGYPGYAGGQMPQQGGPRGQTGDYSYSPWGQAQSAAMRPFTQAAGGSK